MAPAQFAAGWYYGIAKEDKRDELLKCFQSDNDLTNTLFDAMEAYIAGDTMAGDAKIEQTKPLYEKSLAGCGKLTEAIDEWIEKIDAMMARSDWAMIQNQVYEA